MSSSPRTTPNKNKQPAQPGPKSVASKLEAIVKKQLSESKPSGRKATVHPAPSQPSYGKKKVPVQDSTSQQRSYGKLKNIVKKSQSPMVYNELQSIHASIEEVSGEQGSVCLSKDSEQRKTNDVNAILFNQFDNKEAEEKGLEIQQKPTIKTNFKKMAKTLKKQYQQEVRMDDKYDKLKTRYMESGAMRQTAKARKTGENRQTTQDMKTTQAVELEKKEVVTSIEAHQNAPVSDIPSSEITPIEYYGTVQIIVPTSESVENRLQIQPPASKPQIAMQPSVQTVVEQMNAIQPTVIQPTVPHEPPVIQQPTICQQSTTIQQPTQPGTLHPTATKQSTNQQPLTLDQPPVTKPPSPTNETLQHFPHDISQINNLQTSTISNAWLKTEHMQSSRILQTRKRRHSPIANLRERIQHSVQEIRRNSIQRKHFLHSLQKSKLNTTTATSRLSFNQLDKYIQRLLPKKPKEKPKPQPVTTKNIALEKSRHHSHLITQIFLQAKLTFCLRIKSNNQIKNKEQYMRLFIQDSQVTITTKKTIKMQIQHRHQAMATRVIKANSEIVKMYQQVHEAIENAKEVQNLQMERINNWHDAVTTKLSQDVYVDKSVVPSLLEQYGFPEVHEGREATVEQTIVFNKRLMQHLVHRICFK